MYMVVTNDEYEIPLAVLENAHQCAEYLGKSVGSVHRYTSVGMPKNSAEKVLYIPDPRPSKKRRKARQREYYAAYCRRVDRSEYFRQRYQKNKGRS